MVVLLFVLLFFTVFFYKKKIYLGYGSVAGTKLFRKKSLSGSAKMLDVKCWLVVVGFVCRRNL